MLFNTPWANPSDSRLKPAAFQGGDLGYTRLRFGRSKPPICCSSRIARAPHFSRQTLLTSFPAGNPGLASNIFVPGGNGINTNGFAFGKIGYVSPKGISVNGYFYGVNDLVNAWWGDGKYTFSSSGLAPYIALQGGWESNSGQSFIGKINSQVFGVQLGANITKNILLTAGYDSIPWHTDSVFLPTERDLQQLELPNLR